MHLSIHCRRPGGTNQILTYPHDSSHAFHMFERQHGCQESCARKITSVTFRRRIPQNGIRSNLAETPKLAERSSSPRFHLRRMLHNDHPWELFQLHSSGIPSPQINKGLPKDRLYLLFCLPKHSWTLICPHMERSGPSNP